jgi:hypothetical protein
MTAKRTLLEMVQSIMSDMDSDEVDSINDTVEAGQVASIIRDVYEQIVTDTAVPEDQTLGKLDTVSLVDHAGSLNYFHIPDTCERVYWLQYDMRDVGDTDAAYRDLDYIEPHEFIKYVNRNVSGGDTTATVDPISGFSYYIPKLVAPRFYTVFNDLYVAVDAINTGVDATQVLGTKTICMMQTVPAWTMSDNFVPALDDNMFPLLLSEAKSTCFVTIKQQANPKIDKQARTQGVRLQNHKHRSQAAQKNRTGSSGPNYGRN